MKKYLLGYLTPFALVVLAANRDGQFAETMVETYHDL